MELFGMTIKGLLWLWSGVTGMMIKRISFTLIWNGMMIKGISFNSIWNGMMIKGISSTLIIWNWNDDQTDLPNLDLALK